MVKISKSKMEDGWETIQITTNSGKKLRISVSYNDLIMIHTKTSSIDEFSLSEGFNDYEMRETFGQIDIKIKKHL